MNYELVLSKKTIEEKLGKNVDFLCWPGGGLCKKAVEIASKHYKSATLPSKYGIGKKNMYSDNPFFIQRIGVPSIFFNDKIYYFRGLYLYYTLRELNGSLSCRRLRQFLKLALLIKLKLEGIK